MRTRIPGRSEALPTIVAAMIMRMYWGLSLDFQYPLNAAWMCPLVGLAIYLPFAFALRQASLIGDSSPWENLAARVPAPIMGLTAAGFAALLIYDAAAAAGLTAISSNILALDDVSPLLLLIPLALVVFCAVRTGACALGDSARLWLRMLPLFSVIILLVQLGNYKLGWITPILGGGIADILSGGIYCAGCMALTSLLWLLALPDRHKGGLLPWAALAAVVTSAVMFSQQMLIPTMTKTDFTIAARIDLILNNGRMTLSPQIVLDVLWFGNMLHLISAEAVAAAEYLRTILPKIPIAPLAAACALAVCGVSAASGAWVESDPLIVLNLFVVLGAALALLLLTALLGKRGVRA